MNQCVLTVCVIVLFAVLEQPFVRGVIFAHWDTWQDMMQQMIVVVMWLDETLQHAAIWTSTRKLSDVSAICWP